MVCSISQSYLISSVWINDNEKHHELDIYIRGERCNVAGFGDRVRLETGGQVSGAGARGGKSGSGHR